ncbi:IgA-specific serine endopeptidase autotransporter [Burkholderiales bacterium]|nr:IgA-specific serine endopeptidase autotransporter [Burkholderiales bacterium]
MKGERRPQNGFERRRRPGRRLALVLAILVHIAFIGVLVWSVRWQSRAPEVVSAELYAPPAKAREPEPPPRVEPPRPEPKPDPPPKVEPPPPPKVDRHDVELALKAKQEDERRRRDKAEAEKRERDRKAADEKRLAEEKRKADEARAAEARERQQRATEAMREQAEREAAERAQAETKARIESEARARVQAEANARAAAQADWIRRIQAKIRGNVIVPPELPGNPEAVFDVIQLPTGEILEAQLRKSSGFRAYDEAVQRAILKSSPLPRPDRTEMFSRTLTLRFRPRD